MNWIDTFIPYVKAYRCERADNEKKEPPIHIFSRAAFDLSLKPYGNGTAEKQKGYAA